MISPLKVLSLSIPLLFLFGIQKGNICLLLLCGTFFFLIGAAWAFGSESAAHISFKRKFHPGAFEKAETEIRIAVQNKSSFPVLCPVVKDCFPPQDMLVKNVALPKDLPPHTSLEVSYRAACLRHRGIYTIGPIQLNFFDPLGIFERTRRLPQKEEFTVLPLPLNVPDLGLDGRSATFSAFNPDRQTRGESLKFYGVREYMPGDPLRFVHWKASARLGKLVVREFESNLSAEVTVFLDLARSSLAGLGSESTVEYAIRLAAALAKATIAQGHEIQLIGHGNRPLLVPLGSGESHLSYLLRELACIKPLGERPFYQVLRENVSRVPQGSQVYLILGSVHQDPASFAEPLSFLFWRGSQVKAFIMDDRTFLQHDRWKAQFEVEETPQILSFFLSNGIEAKLISKGADLLVSLGQKGGRR